MLLDAVSTEGRRDTDTNTEECVDHTSNTDSSATGSTSTSVVEDDGVEQHGWLNNMDTSHAWGGSDLKHLKFGEGYPLQLVACATPPGEPRPQTVPTSFSSSQTYTRGPVTSRHQVASRCSATCFGGALPYTTNQAVRKPHNHILILHYSLCS